MMEHSKAEQERKLEAARLKAEAEEDSYGKFKAEQERIREAIDQASKRKHQAQTEVRESTPGWGGFS